MRPLRRALHAKAHRTFSARFEVLDNLPEPARQGLFATPRSYDAVVRYSNGSGRVQSDAKPDVRGIAVKLLGVSGPKVLGDAPTQDLLAVLASATPFRTADEFVGTVWALRSPALALFRLIGAFGIGRAMQLVRRLASGLKAPPASLATTPFYSALPIQCGPFAARFRLTPAGAPAPVEPGADVFAEDLAQRIQRAPVVYTLALQFFSDEATTPIEDGSVDWPTPYVDVARLEIPVQDPGSEAGRRLAERVEQLSFDPWHALVEHKPLGNLMRARKHAYFASAQKRGIRPEPASLAELTAP
jgi:hypothetical protein